jgi:hypothetical protein
MNHRRALALTLTLLLSSGLALGVDAFAQQKPSLDSKGVIGTGPVFDWEKVPRPEAGYESRALNDLRLLRFSSAKTLAETTAWLKQVMEQYGHVSDQGPASSLQLSRIVVEGCAIRWTSTWFFDGGRNESLISLNLGDLNLGEHPGTLMVQVIGANDAIRLNTVGAKIRVTTRSYGSGSKLTGERTNPEVMTVLAFRDRDFIAIRAAYAFVHAARRCGAKPPATN